jgi:mannose-1-phosphate guanylyltransferase
MMMSISPTLHIPRKGQVREAMKTDRWAIILAGGDGTRLRSFTRSITGDERPKQFCPIFGGKTLLDQTRDRVALSVPREKTLLVVTESHEEFYKPLADNTATRNGLLVQPVNKGTAPAILYSLLRVAAASPEAVVAIFPSDHYFSDDDKFMSYVEVGFEVARRCPAMVTLLGIAPEAPEIEFGWIEPHISFPGDDRPGAVAPVRRFWEKPSAGVARKLMERGCLWNSFVMIGRVDAFLKITRSALPDLSDHFDSIYPALGSSVELAHLRELYSWLPEINFSHKVLATRPQDLSVMKVDDVGWSDLGEPSRVLQTLGRMGLQTEWARSAS